MPFAGHRNRYAVDCSSSRRHSTRMFSVILYEPEIPPNTGNIIRLCANTGAGLHLVEPLGFELDEKRLRRAGLDYREFVNVQTHTSLDACLKALGGPRVFALSTKNSTRYDRAGFRQGDALLFGPETRGLARRCVAGLAGRAAPAAAHAGRQPQPEPVELGCGRPVRGLAPAGVPGGKLGGLDVAVHAEQVARVVL